MSINLVRDAFQQAALGRLSLGSLVLDNAPKGAQQLTVRGWHADGVPYALVTAPFFGDPVQRAAQLADDIAQLHTGAAQTVVVTPQSVAVAAAPAPTTQAVTVKHMSRKASGLARLMGNLKHIDAAADGLASQLEAHMTNLDTEMATTKNIVGTVAQAVDDLRAVNAQYSNGGPTVDGSSEPSKQ